MNIFTAKLDYSITDDDLRNAFDTFGEVSSAKVIMDKFSGRSKGFGFVEMPDDKEAQQAIDALNDSELKSRQIIVKQANPKESRPRNSEDDRY